MAQLLAPKAQGPGRISQILPTVKCSSCNQPVPISELGDHVCAPPPSPTLKPPMSPRSATFLAQKYQNVVKRSQTPPLQSPSSPAPPRQPSPLRQPPTNNPRVQTFAQRSSQSSISSSYSASPRSVRSPTLSPRDDSFDGGKIAFPTQLGPESPRITPLSIRQAQSIRSGSSISSRTSSSSSQLQSPPLSRSPLEQAMSRAPNQTIPPNNYPGARARAPSNASVRSAVPTIRQPTQSSPAPYDPPPRTSQITGLSPISPRPRAATNAGSPSAFQTGPDVIYSTTPNRPGADIPLRMQPSPAPSMAPSMNGYSSGVPQAQEDIDTKIGGEAGMAGVGRRGFAAAARAALFASNFGPPGREDPFMVVANMDAIQGMDGRRANAPTFLDISSVTNYANTPPLSPNSASSHSPHSPLSVTLPSPSKESGRGSTTPTLPTIASRTPSPGLGRRSIGERVVPPAPEQPKDRPTTPSTPVRLPFFEKFKNMHAPVDVTPAAPIEDDASPLSPGSESSYGGLAYADSDEEDEEVIDKPPASAPAASSLRLSSSTILGSAPPPPPKTAEGTSKVRFPSISSRSSRSDYDTVSPQLPKRSLSASTGMSSYSVRSAAKSTSALDRTMETLFEEDATAQTAASTSSPAVLGLGENPRDSKPPKLPTRSHTSPILGAGRPDSRHGMGKRRPKIRVCAKCDKHIDDGRWIQMDGGTVLCDKCWKNMYLPKCRRCNKPIEKAAVSSSDGQLKGKYHRECFSCFTCQKPFPDKSFYVFDGKPFCAFHYHEANDSLCAATTCGQPIEGSCAISHSGDKYHPEHFTCEWRGCKERLADYWEVEGRMLCEKHAQTAMREGEFEDKDPLDGLDPISVGDEKRDSGAARATKRTTRFIDLASFNAPSGGGSDSASRF